jgi:hypothetical protein
MEHVSSMGDAFLLLEKSFELSVMQPEMKMENYEQIYARLSLSLDSTRLGSNRGSVLMKQKLADFDEFSIG